MLNNLDTQEGNPRGIAPKIILILHFEGIGKRDAVITIYDLQPLLRLLTIYYLRQTWETHDLTI